jgi:hypothetical protein
MESFMEWVRKHFGGVRNDRTLRSFISWLGKQYCYIQRMTRAVQKASNGILQNRFCCHTIECSIENVYSDSLNVNLILFLTVVRDK